MKRNITLFARNAFENAKKSSVFKDSTSYKLHMRNFSNRESIERRNNVFDMEKTRKEKNIGRIEKIEVRYLGTPQDTTLIMNKDMSTPFDCAKHLGQLHTERSALALLDGSLVWDMHRPLKQSCTLELLHYTIADPLQVNRAFWRTCSFLLGAVVARAFKDQHQVLLHSFPAPDVRSGSFVYDVELAGLPDWQPEAWELRALSAEFVKLSRSTRPVERLSVSEEVALDIFQDDPHKSKQIPDIARKNEGNVILYRAGDHIDISKGPMIGSSAQIGRVAIPAVHRLSSPETGLTLHRFQGVALPSEIIINHVAFKILTDRAAKLNPAKSPLDPTAYASYTEERITQAV